MSEILSAISSLATTLMSLLGNVATAVVGNPILLIFVILGLSFAGIGIFKRLTRRG